MDPAELGRALGRLEAGMEAMQNDVTDIKAGVADYRRLKNRLVGVCVTISVIVGSLWDLIVQKYGSHS